MKQEYPARSEWKKLCGREKKSVTQRPEQECRRSRRSEQADHVKEPSAWEHQQDGHCEPDAVTSRGGSGRAAHESTRSRLAQGEALTERKTARRTRRFLGARAEGSFDPESGEANLARREEKTRATVAAAKRAEGEWQEDRQEEAKRRR